jgi:phosphatidylinositol-3-phosphatase
MHRCPMLLARVAATGIAAAAAVALAAPAQAAASSPCGHVRRAPSWHHIVVIAFENHSYRDILGRSAPRSYMKMLAHRCGSAVDYRAVHFPRSLPNYLAATGGRIVTTADCLPGPGCRSGRGNIFSQLGGRNWRVFGESMPRPCYGGNTRLYVSRHAPALYYTRIPRAVCRADVVPLPSHRLKLKRKFTWIVPNLQHDMHDGTPAQASAWLKSFLGGTHGVLHRRPYTRGHTAVFIWFDSASQTGSVATPIPYIVISPSTPAKVAVRPLNHFSSLRTWESMLHLPCRGAACFVRGLRIPFHL